MHPLCAKCRVTGYPCSGCKRLQVPAGWRKEALGNGLLVLNLQNPHTRNVVLAITPTNRCLEDACKSVSRIAEPCRANGAALVWPNDVAPNEADISPAIEKLARRAKVGVIAVGAAGTAFAKLVARGLLRGAIVGAVLAARNFESVPAVWESPSRLLFLSSSAAEDEPSLATHLAKDGRHHVETATLDQYAGSTECCAICISFFARSFVHNRVVERVRGGTAPRSSR